MLAVSERTSPGSRASLYAEDGTKIQVQPLDWRGVDDDGPSQLPVLGYSPPEPEHLAKPDLEAQLKDMTDFVEENEYKPGIYKLEFDNVLKRKVCRQAGVKNITWLKNII
jgi:hypothetical protein